MCNESYRPVDTPHFVGRRQISVRFLCLGVDRVPGKNVGVVPIGVVDDSPRDHFQPKCISKGGVTRVCGCAGAMRGKGVTKDDKCATSEHVWVWDTK